MAASPSIALHWERDGEHFLLLLCMAISDKKKKWKEDQDCRCVEIMTKWKVLVAIGAGMSVLFCFFC